MDLFPFLRPCPLLRGFSDDGVRIVQSVVTARQLDAGMPIFVQRMLGESAFFLVHGEVAVSVARQNQEQQIGVLVAPDAFGELALLYPGPRRATTRTTTPALLLELTRRDFLTLQSQRPQACLKLSMNITERFAQRAIEAGSLLDRLCELT